MKLEDLVAKRWFRARAAKPVALRLRDSAELAGARLELLTVEFEDGASETYAAVSDENAFGSFLGAAFGGGGTREVKGRFGTFKFESHAGVPGSAFDGLAPLGLDQSNSAFCNPGSLFAKLFRRLEAGAHPEEETLKFLAANGFTHAPELLGGAFYECGEGSFALAVLERHLAPARNAFEAFTEAMDEALAALLGRRTAELHEALAALPGNASAPETPPFDKLETLLKTSSGSLEQRLLRELPKIRSDFLSQLETAHALPEQRIHGDYHLGQVLLHNGDFCILDFEGEPSRPLGERRRLRSRAADLAGMLRSFGYAEAVGGKSSEAAARAFLKAYAERSQIPPETLARATAPFVISKAVYEACYELEFRPGWFRIPASALLGG